MDDEKCIVFSSENTQNGKRRKRGTESSPSKRQRIAEPSGLDASRQLREDIYRDLWNYQRDSIQEVLDEANTITLNEITTFLEKSNAGRVNGIIPTGYVLAGPDTTSHLTFFKQLWSRINHTGSSQILATLNASECPNVRTLFKNLIEKFTSQDDYRVSEDYSIRLLDYDLESFRIWLKHREFDVVTIAIENGEAFHPQVLQDMIDHIRYFNFAVDWISMLTSLPRLV
jgi:origin recognition complex (ORC) subunit 3